MVEKFTTENFETDVLQAGKAVLVDFYADWCGPCKMLAPAVEAAAEEFAGKVTVGKLNIDENIDIAERYGVMSIPTLILFQGGKEVNRMVGLQSKDALSRFVNAAL
ncbi:MAG: thioredoxin [Lachnospiraceae bacterium]|nr:thioredoxin [Lachnospiraceae bacterium]